MNQRGVTLVELLITMVISAIAFMTLAVPFVAERTMWGVGRRQTEAQRGAQFVMRAIAREARQGSSFTIIADGLEVDIPGCGTTQFERHEDNTLHIHRCDGSDAVLIDGTLSRALAFSAFPVPGDDALIGVRIHVEHGLTSGDPRREDEVLETRLLLRNA